MATRRAPFGERDGFVGGMVTSFRRGRQRHAMDRIVEGPLALSPRPFRPGDVGERPARQRHRCDCPRRSGQPLAGIKRRYPARRARGARERVSPTRPPGAPPCSTTPPTDCVAIRSASARRPSPSLATACCGSSPATVSRRWTSTGSAKKRLPPPVRIERVLADTRGIPPTATSGCSPPRTGHLQINYAGLSLRAPEKVRFQYLMEGFDERWVDAGTRRRPSTPTCRPGRYRFRVKAENDGVASESEAVWALPLRRRSTRRAGSSCCCSRSGAATPRHGVAAAGPAGAQQVLADPRRAVADGAGDPRHPAPEPAGRDAAARARWRQTVDESAELAAKQQLGRLRQQLEFYIREARQSIRDLRSPLLQTRDLVDRAARDGRTADRRSGGVRIRRLGPARRAPAKVEEHVLRIAQEAIANALRHATAETVTVNLTYTADSLALRVIR